MPGLPRHNIDALHTAEWIRLEADNEVLLRIGPRTEKTGYRLLPREAVEMARWILDTYAIATMPVTGVDLMSKAKQARGVYVAASYLGFFLDQANSERLELPERRRLENQLTRILEKAGLVVQRIEWEDWMTDEQKYPGRLGAKQVDEALGS